MKTKTRGKAIIGIAMAAVIVVALMAMVPSVSARDVTEGDVIIIGETNATFLDTETEASLLTDGIIKGPTDKVGDTPKNAITIALGTTGCLDTTDYSELVSATYLVYYNNNVNSYEVVLNNPLFTLKTVNTAGDDVESCIKDGTIDINLRTNLEIINNTENVLKVDYKIIGPDGVERNIAGENLGSSGNNVVAFTKTDAVGEYTVYVETDKDTCNGLDVSSSSITFNVIESGVILTSDVATQTETGEVIFTGSTNPLTIVTLTVSDGTDANVWFVGGKGQLSADKKGDEEITVTSLETGIFSFVCNFTDTGSYTIKATNEDDETATVAVDIVSPSAMVITDMIAYSVGQKVTISGMANVGDSVAIAIDDVWEKEDATIKEDGTFSYKWTSSGVVGARKVEIWIQPTTTIGDIPVEGEDETATAAADATTSFLLCAQTLTAEMDKTVMALGDKVTISGTAKGVTQVEIVIVAPKGAGGKTLVAGATAGDGYEFTTATVSSIDYSFSKELTSSTSAASGTHWIGVFMLGADDYYGDNSNADTIVEALEPYTLTGKTKEQIVAILKAVTIGKIASDDLIWEGEIKLEAASISLDTIADVAVGDTLNITGVCNRELYAILVTVTGASPATTVVGTASVTVSDGVYSTSIDTTDWAIGTYTVNADDGDGHMAETIVGIVTEIVPVSTPTPTPTATPTPKPTAVSTPVPTVTPEPTAEPTPEPPGFEAVFAIAGLLSIAYLVLRKRRE